MDTVVRKANYAAWYKIEEEIPEITDLRMEQTDDRILLRYKQNGEEKVFITTDKSGTFLIQCLTFSAKALS